jgi:hypothetical protein
VKLAAIRVGEDYAVRIDYRRLIIEYDVLGSVPYASVGYRATALGFEKRGGRTLVRVELTAQVLRVKEAREANPDGTWTIWHGHVVDDHDIPIEDEVTYDLLVESSQVACEWTEAVVQQSVGSLDRDWERFEAT